MFDPLLAEVMRVFGLAGHASQDLGSAGGFSGARFWRVEVEDQTWCLRRWPRATSPARVAWIHGVVREVANSGIGWLAAPRTTSDGGTCWQAGDGLYEISPWLPGAADFHDDPSSDRLSAAMLALAEFHKVASSLSPLTDHGRSPGMQRRARRCRVLLCGEADRLEQVVAASPGDARAALGLELLSEFRCRAPASWPAIDRAARLTVPLHPCLRDIWHDHVLFIHNRVSGIVDYDAIQVETVSGDLARLLGSLVGDNAQQWQEGLSVYRSQRPLQDRERELVSAFDAANVLLSGPQWLKWIFVDRREFEDRDSVLRRLQAILKRLKARHTSFDENVF